MSANGGGQFRLVSSDGKADRMLTATALLNNRLREVMCARIQANMEDPVPMLADIERTHVLFVNTTYKPYVAIANEYQKTRPNSGSTQWGQQLQFSIPQFGDFFADMVVNISLSEAKATVGLPPPLPAHVGTDPGATITNGVSVSGTSDTVSGVYTKYTHEYVDIAGNHVGLNDPVSNFVRYAEYPGSRLFSKVRFDVNGNILGEYTDMDMAFYQKTRIPENKLLAWKRMIGQEVPIKAYSDPLSIQGESVFPPDVVNLIDVDGNPVSGGAVSASTTSRKIVKIVNGPQTPKAVQPRLNMMIPLNFWFNSFELAVPSVAIPYGQRFITIDLAEQDKLLFVAPGNLFLKYTVEKQYSDPTTVGAGTPASEEVERVERYVTLTPTLANGSTIDHTQQIVASDLYINNLFVNPEIHDIYIRRIGFTMVRMFLSQKTPLSNAEDSILLSQLKFPIETLWVGAQPNYNVSPENPNQYRDWHRFTRLYDRKIEVLSTSESEVATVNGPFDAGVGVKSFNSTSVVETLTYPEEVETIDTLGIESQGIGLYDSSHKAQFYRDYKTYTYGGCNINAPEDHGVLMINFALHPGQYQPSGHLNMSRARETHIRYKSSVIGAANPAMLIVSACAINFMLIADGSAVLRYQT